MNSQITNPLHLSTRFANPMPDRVEGQAGRFQEIGTAVINTLKVRHRLEAFSVGFGTKLFFPPRQIGSIAEVGIQTARLHFSFKRLPLFLFECPNVDGQ